MQESSTFQKNSSNLRSTTLNNEQQILQIQFPSSSPLPHKKYGEMVVIWNSKNIFITLGPNYVCFAISYTLFLVSGIFLIILVHNLIQNLFLSCVNLILICLQLLFYLLVALSNPGIVTSQTVPYQQSLEQDKIKVCRKCKRRMTPKQHHCRQCDVCILQYDHHCPWTSKCIGKGNARAFSFFICYTPIYLLYYIIVLIACLANGAIQANNRIKE